MKLQDILSDKGTFVFTVTPSTTLAEVVRQMVDHNVGSMVVCDREQDDGEQCERLVGIVTERDLLRCFATGRCDLARLRASDIMTTHLVTATPDDSVDDLMGVMTEHRVRHLPVMNGERIVGMVSIGDLLKAHHDHLAVENHFMRDYIHG
jgi:CBS domain-containing protein